MLIMTVVTHNLNWGKQHWTGILEADAKGYYAHLPALFIYQDLNYGFFDEIETKKYANEHLFYDYRIGADGHIINKYYCGTALAQLPFFLIAHTVAHFSNYDADGYSKPYPLLITIAALFYLFIGLMFMDRTLQLYNIAEWARAVVPVVATFGTNLFYYAVVEPGMSHIYSFAFVAMFIHYSAVYFRYKKLSYTIIIAIIYGLIVLIRPVNGLVLLALPFIAGGYSSFIGGIRHFLRHGGYVVYGLLSFAAILFIQLMIYKVSTGSFLLYTYGEEKLDLLNPHFFEILFSYRKGLFLYTPVYLVSLAGLFFVKKRSTFEFYAILGHLIVVTYVLSSWWMWYYGGSFSSRVFVDQLPFFMLLMAFALHGIRGAVVKYGAIALLFSLTALCQLQTYQYRYYLIHWSEMTKEKYWDVFLQLP